MLSIRDLSVRFFTANHPADVVRNVSFDIKPGKIFALVGCSGCGKTVTALSIMHLIPSHQGKVTGQIILDGREISLLSERQLRRVRGREISIVFQEPKSSFNPVYTIGNQITEVIRLHQGLDKKEAYKNAVELLRAVGISQPEEKIRQYPHQFSGGMLQRAMIAMAISCNPKLLIADEPTSSLDVTTEAEILDLLCQLQKDKNISILLITHNLGIVADRADYIAVMYQGQIVEQGKTQTILKNPSHPYTKSLLKFR